MSEVSSSELAQAGDKALVAQVFQPVAPRPDGSSTSSSFASLCPSSGERSG
jgi:hypothetical protein